MDLMKILFGFFVFKSIFHEAQPCNIENNYYYDDCDDYDEDYACEDFDDYSDCYVCDDFIFDLDF